MTKKWSSSVAQAVCGIPGFFGNRALWSDAGLGDRFSYAARATDIAIMVPNSTGVNGPGLLDDVSYDISFQSRPVLLSATAPCFWPKPCESRRFLMGALASISARG